MSARPNLAAEALSALLEACGIPVTVPQAEQLASYLALLLRWNARTNLTAIREPEEIVRRHFADSLFCARQIPASAQTVLDFGSGGGFPGIPIALVRPELSVTLAESQGRKAAFLQEAVRTLGLHADVWAQRVESMTAERCFDCVTLRAVDRMLDACRSAASRVAPEGLMLVFSTERLQEGVQAALPELHWQTPLHLPHAKQGLLLIARR